MKLPQDKIDAFVEMTQSEGWVTFILLLKEQIEQQQAIVNKAVFANDQHAAALAWGQMAGVASVIRSIDRIIDEEQQK